MALAAPGPEDGRSGNRDLLRVAGGALLVCVAYYLGSKLGLAFRFEPGTPSVLWPPNAILTATLLLVDPRRWWVYLLAAFPAHLGVQLGAGFPISLILPLFVTNCSEALIAALGVWGFSDAPGRFDTLRRMAVFIVAAGLAAPFLSSFADAAVVAILRGELYWQVWGTRFFSNVLTELTLVPTIVIVISAGPDWLRRATHRRRAEAALLAVGLLVTGGLVFEGPLTLPGAPRTPLACLLPFLLWAAVRFGPGGLSLALLATTLQAIRGGIQGRGPFTGLPPAEGVLTLQIFLSVVIVPLLCLAALIVERRYAKEALEERLRFEELQSRLSGAFVHLPSHEMDQAIDTWLRRLGDVFGLDRLALRELLAGVEPAPEVTREWVAADPLRVSRLSSGPELHGAIQPDGPDLRIMLEAGDRVLGDLTFARRAKSGDWAEPLVQRLRLAAEVFANALARKRSEDALRASEAMKSSILASLPSQVVVLDREGRIIAFNESWMRLARSGMVRGAEVGIGVSYLDVCRQAAADGMEHAGDVLAGIQAVLDGSRAGFAMEYACAGPAEYWIAMTVVPLSRPAGGAVVAHTDVTERKRVEMDAQRSRQELSHFARVSTMGELAASLAHELSQPLTGILTNAQAARRFLESRTPDFDELRSILSDIVEDDRRASEVIQRLRELLRKGEPTFAPLDLHQLIRDVVRLVSSDAIIRNVSLTLDLGAGSPIVRGDRVQLQQVVLNLLVNGLEAVAEGAGDERTVVVRARSTDVHTVHVSVEDAGPGLRPGTEALVFEPFYTTKPAGMGMGLAIARSIVEAHGGLIWALNTPTRGAAFHVALPLAGETAP
jgi:signal transduction histidine kinase/integral membrane sensor domain MASE1